MTADFSDVILKLEELKELLANKIQTSPISPSQLAVVEGLSDISKRLGLIQSGEFRSGNSVDPGKGFSGVRIGYPPFSYGGEDWNIAGVNNDHLQFGLRASDGSALFGRGAINMDEDGLNYHSYSRGLTFRDYPGETFWVGGASVHGTSEYGIFGMTLGGLEHSDDFEDGTLNAWTITGSPILQSGDSATSGDSYYCTVSNTGYISKNFTIASGERVYMVFKARRNANSGATSSPLITLSNSTLSMGSVGSTAFTSAWQEYVLIGKTTSSTQTLTIRAFNDDTRLYDIDEISIYSGGNWSLLGTVQDGMSVWNMDANAEITLKSNAVTAMTINETKIKTHIPIAFMSIETPATPFSTLANCYQKNGKIIFQYNDGGTVRYKYLDLTGTGVTWVHTTTAP